VNKDTGEYKKTIFLVASNSYLFFTTGVYILAELTQQYKLILFVSSDLKSSKTLTRITSYYNIQVVFLPKRGKYFPKHLTLVDLFNSYLNKSPPSAIIQNNYSNIENAYLFFLAKKKVKNCINMVYVNGRPIITDEKKSILDIRKKYAYDIANQIGLGYTGIFIFYMLCARSSINKYINYYIAPFLILGEFLYSFSAKFNFHKKNKRSLFDIMLVYKQNELMISDAIEYEGEVIRIQSPQTTYGEECNRIMYGEENRSKYIIVAPSLIGFYAFEKEKIIIEKWVNIIKILKTSFKNYKVLFKLHPRTNNNRHYDKTIRYIISKLPDLTIINNIEKIEPLIISGKVIVSDVSSVLWWASNFSNKIPISFDLGNFPSSGDMKMVEGVYCFKYHDKFTINEFETTLHSQINGHEQAQQCLLSICNERI
jgi:hypothetical protein